MEVQVIPLEKIALRAREAAELLSVSERTLWKWAKQGRIPCVKTSKERTATVLYPVEALKKFMRDMASNPENTGGVQG